MGKLYSTLSFTSLLLFSVSYGQNPLLIPDTISGTSINLTIEDSVHQFYTGYYTNTIGYNGSYLGPTILLNKWQNVTLNVDNQLADTTTTHWHGLHVLPMNDGSPHNPILANTTWSPSFTVMDNAATYWYHPHLHMTTFGQVVKGAAGLIIVRDSVEAALTLPRTYGVDDIPLIFQFKTMDTATKQIFMADSMDNVVMANGVINPYANFPAQVVRLRLLNASSMRVFRFGFDDNRTFYQITSDDGLLNAPVPLTRLTLGVGERAEILVDLSGDLGDTLYLKTFGNELPQGFPGGPPSMMCGIQGLLDNISFNILQINVVAQTTNPVTTIPSTLTTNNIWSTTGVPTRNFAFQAAQMMSCDFVINSTVYNANVNNFTTQLNNTEIWEIQNMTPIAHPFHIHGNHYFILTRNGNPAPLNEQGRKDLVLIGPMETVRLITKYENFCDSVMPYMYHCHILKHEDMGMMGQFIVGCSSTGVEDMNDGYADISIYPNPSSGQITISSERESMTKITITDELGKVAYEETISGTQASADISSLPEGIYFIKIYTGSSMHMYKLVKSR